MVNSFNRHFSIALVDTTLVVAGFIITLFIHHGFTFSSISNVDTISLSIFLLIWMAVSHLSKKFRVEETVGLTTILSSVIISNFLILGLLSIILFITQSLEYSRFLVFGTIFLATTLELMFAVLYHSILQSEFLMDWIGPETFKPGESNGNGAKTLIDRPPDKFVKGNGSLRKALVNESGEEASGWIFEHVNLKDPTTLLLATTTRFNVENQPDNYYTGVVNLKRINDIQRINKFFESVNEKLPEGGIFIGCGETYSLRKSRILNKYPPILNYLIYTNDYLFKRVFPKVKLTNKLYFLITRGKNRVISRTETLGRLYCCGFEVLEEKNIGNLLYFKTRKIRTPFYDYHPTYGPLIRLRRIGKNKKIFNVYKLRTMHAYAEYVQGYVYDNHSLDEGGKFKDDFRVTTLGRILRKFWLDELPMLFNLLKGDMKIVGVRPLSNHYFSLYSKELQEKRIKTRPGLIPPYYAQYPTPVTLEEIQANEMKYLTEHEQKPLRTDVKYFFLAFYNILWKRARSK